MYGVSFQGNQLVLLKYQDTVGSNGAKNGTKDNWRSLINLYGAVTNGISQVRLTQSDGTTEVVGTVAYHPTDDTILLFTVDIDTIPVNTLTAVTAIVNPITTGPGAGLPAAAAGQRYILTDSIGNVINQDGADAWEGLGEQDLIANVNDIVQFDGTQWTVEFTAADVTSIEYVTNIATNQQYKWTGSRWIRSYEGEYREGTWSVVL